MKKLLAIGLILVLLLSSFALAENDSNISVLEEIISNFSLDNITELLFNDSPNDSIEEVMVEEPIELVENSSSNQTNQSVADEILDTTVPQEVVETELPQKIQNPIVEEAVQETLDGTNKDYEVLNFKGKQYRAYPILAQVNQNEEKIMNDRVNIKQLRNGKQLKVVNEKIMVFERGDEDTFRVESSEDIYQIDDIRDSQEWGYLGTGTGTDTITASGSLIQKGNYICIQESKLDNMRYGDCIEYPPVLEERILTDGSTSYSNLVSIDIDGNVAIVSYPLPYDPILVNETHPVIGYVTADGGTGTEDQTFKDIITNNSFQNFSYISIRAQNSNLSNYESLVDVFYIGDKFISSGNTYIWQLNQTQKGLVVAPSSIVVDHLEFCESVNNFAGTDVNIINNSLPVYNTTNGIGSTGSLTMYNSFKDFRGCDDPNIGLSNIAQRKSTGAEYNGFIIENGTTINGSYTTQSRMIFSMVADSQASEWLSIAEDIAIQEILWALNLDGSSSSGGSNSSGGGSNSSSSGAGQITITPGSIDVTTSYKTNGTTGITDSSSFWLCKDSSCNTRCQVHIEGGIITTCN